MKATIQKEEVFSVKRSQTFSQSVFVDLLLLVLPSLLLMGLLTLTFYTYGISLFLIYFVLPMFYTVDQRLRQRILSEKVTFTYADGYVAFFASNKAGIFGVIMVLLISSVHLLICAFLLSPSLPSLMGLNNESALAFEKFSSLILNSSSGKEILTFFFEEMQSMIRPLTIYFGLVCFLPVFSACFLLVDDHLINHYLAELVLPDLDENISSSQARNIARSTFNKGYASYRYKKQWLRNWPYYLAFTIIYGLFLWASSTLTAKNLYAMPPILMLAPCCSYFLGLMLNYFCLMNSYVSIEESKDVLLSSMDEKQKECVFKTYHLSSYIHGKESLLRGSFIKEKEEKDREDKLSGYVIDLSMRHRREK